MNLEFLVIYSASYRASLRTNSNTFWIWNENNGGFAIPGTLPREIMESEV